MEKNWNSSWDGFKPGRWNRTSVNVRNFTQERTTLHMKEMILS